jgi:prephenate dehydratase
MVKQDIIKTLGPSGTDAHAEAVRIGGENIELFPSFRAAIDDSETYGGRALVAAGYLDMNNGSVVDSWVDLHFSKLKSMTMVGVWESPTKPMCVAVHSEFSGELKDIRTAASHPATLQFVREHLPADVAVSTVRAKPEAARLVSEQAVDACIGSVDVVESIESLKILKKLEATMVWCLYEHR